MRKDFKIDGKYVVLSVSSQIQSPSVIVTAEERSIANALGALPCIACYMHGVISEEVSLHHISGRTAPGCHKKQLPLCRWHHQHAAPAEVRAKYPWLVPVHADGVVGGKKEFTLLNKSEMELLADAYEMANIMH